MPPASSQSAKVTQSSNAAVTRPPSLSINLDEKISAATDQSPSQKASAKKFAGIIDKQPIFNALHVHFLTDYQVLVTVYTQSNLFINKIIVILNFVAYFAIVPTKISMFELKKGKYTKSKRRFSLIFPFKVRSNGRSFSLSVLE